jgi:hypothetical protein
MENKVINIATVAEVALALRAKRPNGFYWWRCCKCLC